MTPPNDAPAPRTGIEQYVVLYWTKVNGWLQHRGDFKTRGLAADAAETLMQRLPDRHVRIFKVWRDSELVFDSRGMP